MPTSARFNRRQILMDVGIRAAIVCSAVLLAVVHSASAHPGHSLLDHGAAHVIASPYHLLILATLGLAMMASAQIVPSRSVQQFLRIAGVGAVISAGVLCGLGY